MIHGLVYSFIAILYSPVFFGLYRYGWKNIDYTHAYYILPVSLFAVWRERKILSNFFIEKKQLITDSLKFEKSGFFILCLGLAMFAFGWRQGYTFVSAFSLLPVLWGSVRYLYGKKVVKFLNFPIFFLLFLVPPPLGILDAVTMPMRYGVFIVAEKILLLFHYPIERNGLLLTMGDNEIFMGAPCSGFRSFITMLALTIAYAHFIKANKSKRFYLMASALPFSMVGNLVRVLSICFITFYFGQEAAEGFFHDFSGMLIFLIVIGCLMLFENIIDKFQKKKI